MPDLLPKQTTTFAQKNCILALPQIVTDKNHGTRGYTTASDWHNAAKRGKYSQNLCESLAQFAHH